MVHESNLNLHQITGGACRRLPGLCPHTVCRFNLTSERSERVRQIRLGALAKVWRHLCGNEGRDRASTVGMRRRPRIAA